MKSKQYNPQPASSERTPLIILILKLPIKIIEFILYFVGCFTYLPIYITCLILKPFLFAEAFKTNFTFYALFTIPRAILSLGGYVAGLLELYLIHEYVIKAVQLEEASRLSIIMTWVSVIAFIMFSFRYGYKILFNRFKLPQLKSPLEHLELLWEGILDLLGFVLAVLTTLMIFNVKRLFMFKVDMTKRKFLAFVTHLFVLSIFDVLTFSFWVLLFLLHWRFRHALKKVEAVEGDLKKRGMVIVEAFQALVDSLFIPFLAIAILNPFFKVRRIVSYMSKIEIVDWRSYILLEFGCAIRDLICFVLLVLNLVTIYQIKYVFKIFSKGFKSSKPEQLNPALVVVEGVGKKSFLQQISEFNSRDTVYTLWALDITITLFADLLLLVMSLVLHLTVYRIFYMKKYLIYKKSKDEKFDASLYTYAASRKFLHKKIIAEEKIHLVRHVHGMYFENFVLVFVDIPFVLLGLLSIFVPWRIPGLVRKIKEEWKALETNWVWKPETGMRVYVFRTIFIGLIDYIVFVLSLVTLIGFWRIPLILFELRLLRDLPKDEYKKNRYNYVSKYDAYQSIVANLLVTVIVDFLLLVPFFLVCVIGLWRMKQLFRVLKKTSVDDTALHRSICQQFAWGIITDLIWFIVHTLIVLTVFRISTHSTLVQKVKAELEKSGHPINENQNKFDAIIENQISMDLYPVYKTCSFRVFGLLLLDILSLPFFISGSAFIVSIPYFVKRRKQRIQKYVGLNSSHDYMELQMKLIQLRFKLLFVGIAELISITVTIAMLSLLLWRSQTFIKIIKNAQLTETYVKEAQPKHHDKILMKKKNKIGFLIAMMFAQMIKDLPYFVLFLLTIIIGIWRVPRAFLKAIRGSYDMERPIVKQFDESRQAIFDGFWEAKTDFFTAWKVLILTITVVRLPFLYYILLKNRFPHSSCARRAFKHDVVSHLTGQRLGWKKCIHITFKELLKDLPYIPIGLITIVIAPWRIVSLILIMKSQKERIPTQDIDAKRIILESKRKDIARIFVRVFYKDYINILKFVVIISTVHRIPNLAKIFYRYFSDIKRYHSGELNIQKEIQTEFVAAFLDIVKAFYSLIILVLILRVQKALKRLKRLKNYKEKIRLENERIARYAKNENEEKSSLNDIDWGVYGIVSEYLTIKDMGNLSCVNKKFNELNKRSEYWDQQYERNWKKIKLAGSFLDSKQKCIAALKKTQKKKPMSQEEMDRAFGTYYILLDEAQQSVQNSPHLLLLPMKAIGYAASKIQLPGDIATFLNVQNQKYLDSITYMNRYSQAQREYKRIIDEIQESKNSFKNAHLTFLFYLLLGTLKYISVIGYFHSWLFYMLMKVSAAGPFNRRNVVVNNPDANILWDFAQQDNFIQQEHEPNIYKRYFKYQLQMGGIIALILYLFIFTFSPAYIYCFYFNWRWFHAIVGPVVLNLPHYLSTVSVVVTMFSMHERYTLFFAPYRAITMNFHLAVYIKNEFWNKVGRPVYEQIANVMKGIYVFSTKTIASIINGIKTGVKFVLKKIAMFGKGTFRSYVGVLTFVTKKMLPFGYVGDCILTPFAFVWMWWPGAICYFYRHIEYYIPSGIVCLMLTIIGYKEINKVSKSPANRVKAKVD